MTDFTLNQGTGVLGLASHGRVQDYNAFERINFAAFPLVSTGTHDIFRIPAGTWIEKVGYRILTPQGGAATIGLGDAGLATRFLTTADMNAAAGTTAILNLLLTTGTPNTVTGGTDGFWYPAAGVLRITANSTINVAVVEFFAWGKTFPINAT